MKAWKSLQTQSRCSDIFTDGSKIDGGVGGAMTWWKEGREARFSTFRLESFYTVFQAELFALHKAIQAVIKAKDGHVGIYSDTKSSLEMLANPSPPHRLALKAQMTIREIRAEERSVRLDWVRAHVGTIRNERADELAKLAAHKTTAAD